MTLSEFKAWLEGYSASFVDAPNAKQWLVITEKLATVGVAPQVSIPPVKPFTTPNDWQRQRASDYTAPLVVRGLVDTTSAAAAAQDYRETSAAGRGLGRNETTGGGNPRDYATCARYSDAT